MADKDLTIGIKTTATGTGARDTAREIDKLAEVTASASNKASVSEWGFYDLDKAMGKTAVSTQTLTAGMTKLAPTTRNNANALLLFSQGFEDAQYGIRGVLNNIPGLIIALGGTAGLAGAISIAAVGLSQIIPLFTKAEEKASDVAERIDKISENMGELEGERFDDVLQEFDDLRKAAESVKDQVDLTKAADESYAISALENASQLAQAQRNITIALGEQVDKTKELISIAEAEQAKRELAAKQAIDAEQAKIEKAREAQTTAADILGERKAQQEVEAVNLVALRAQLATLREQKAESEAIANRKIDPGGILQNLIRGVPAQAEDVSRQREERRQAREQLKDPAFKEELEGTQARVDELAEKIRTQTRAISSLENALNAAVQSTEDIESSVGIKVKEISDKLAQSTLLSQTETLLQTQEQQAKDLTAAIDQIQTSTEVGRAAKASIAAAAADGRITANESEQLARDSVTIIGQIQAGLATAGTNTQEILNLMRTLALQSQSNSRELKTLKKLVEEGQ